MRPFLVLTLILMLQTQLMASPAWGFERGALRESATIHFIDVGHGDATLIELPCGTILFDSASLRKQNKAKFSKLSEKLL